MKAFLTYILMVFPSVGTSGKRALPGFHKSLLISLLILVFCLPISAQESQTLSTEVFATSFRGITSLFIAPTAVVFAVEQDGNRVIRFNLDGTRTDSIGRLGSGHYQFDQPLDLDATNELKIFISDYNNNRIQVFDRRLQYLSSVQLPRVGNMRGYRPTFLTVNNLGELFFYDEENEYIYKFNFNGSFEQRFSTKGDDQILKPSGMITIDDAIFIADPTQKVVHFMTDNGRYLGFIATFSELSAISTWSDKLFIADGTRIVVYNMYGRKLGIYQFEGISRIKAMAVYRDIILISDGNTIFKAHRQPFAN